MKHNTQIHLDYLYKLAIVSDFTNLNKKIVNKLIERANKDQIKLKKIKRNICFKCSQVLVPEKNSKIIFQKKKNGSGMLIKCLQCKQEKFYVQRGKK